jgi:hypothetical protein
MKGMGDTETYFLMARRDGAPVMRLPHSMPPTSTSNHRATPALPIPIQSLLMVFLPTFGDEAGFLESKTKISIRYSPIQGGFQSTVRMRSRERYLRLTRSAVEGSRTSRQYRNIGLPSTCLSRGR